MPESTFEAQQNQEPDVLLEPTAAQSRAAARLCVRALCLVVRSTAWLNPGARIVRPPARMPHIREEAPADAAGIEAVVVAAFRSSEHSSGTEHCIVRALRDADRLTLSLVAEERGHVVGHVAVSPVTVSDGSPGWYGLGPVSVAPERQGQGLGTALVTAALDGLRRLDAAGCVVLGDPAYYARFGFRREEALVLPEVPAEYFQAIGLRGGVPSGQIAYHAAFTATS